MIIRHQTNVAAFAGNHVYYWLPNQIISVYISVTSAAPTEQRFGVHIISIPSYGRSIIAGRFS